MFCLKIHSNLNSGPAVINDPSFHCSLLLLSPGDNNIPVGLHVANRGLMTVPQNPLVGEVRDDRE